MKHLQLVLAPICSVTCPNSIHMSFFLYSCSRPSLGNPAGSLRRHAELMRSVRSLLGPLAGDRSSQDGPARQHRNHKSRPIKADYFRRLARVWHMQFRFAGSGSSLQRQLQQRLGRELCGRPLISSVHKMSASSNWPFQLLFHSADVFTLVLTVSMLTTSRRPQAPQFWGNRVETDCQFIS